MKRISFRSSRLSYCPNPREKMYPYALFSENLVILSEDAGKGMILTNNC